MRGDVTDAGQTTERQKLKIELLSQWKLEAESRNFDEQSFFAFVVLISNNVDTFALGYPIFQCTGQKKT